MKKGDVIYYARVIPNILYEVCELKIRTVEDTYFVGIENRSKHAFPFNYNELDKIVFYDRKIALQIVKEAEKNKTKNYSESSYDEY